MKTIGLIGGMSWESSLEYYKIINDSVKSHLGSAHSAKCIMYSFDFEEIKRLQFEGNWEELTNQMINISKKLKDAGADFIVICTNTMHIMAPDIEREVKIKVLHIADATGEMIISKKLNKVALLGTNFTMKGDFYKKRLKDKFDVDVIIPKDKDCEIVHQIIYDELVKGFIKESSKKEYITIIKELADQGAEGVILGCTEIPLLIQQKDVRIPIFDTTRIHSEAAVDFSLRI